MPARRGLTAPQNTFLDTIATRFDGTHSNFVLGNAQVPNLYPIVYCSDGFCELTGYARAQIMQKGCACSFLFGDDTEESQKKQIEQALNTKTELKLELTFYKSNGTPFQCLLDIIPIKNEKHEVVLFLASHKDVTKSKNDSDSDNEEDDDEEVESPGQDTNTNPYQRRRSRAVLYQLSGHYRRRENVQSKLKLNNKILRSSALPEYKAASLEKPRFILSHYGAFKTFFDWLILIATFYVAIVVPFSATFRDKQNKEPIKTIYLDVFVEITFIIDIILSFRTTYVNKKGEVVVNTRSIMKHYLKGWFVCDLLAALPFDTLYAANLYSRNTLIHLLKLTRLLRLVRLFAKMDRYSQYSYIILTLLMLMFSLLAHWLACLWYVIAVEEIELNPPNWDVSWLHQLSVRLGYDVTNQTDVASAYITALYFTTSSLTSVGFGNVAANTNAEKVFSVFIMLIGALMHAVVFGNVTAIIQRMYARRSQYQTKFRDLKDFFRLHQIPKRLRQRMIEYFQTTWSLNHGIDTNEVLCEFPDELRGDVSLHLHREILSLPIFETAPQGFLKLMSRSVKSNFCAPGEFLVHTGDALSYLYLVCHGSMEVLQEDMVVAILGKGDLVGCDIPFSLIPEALVKSSSDVKALTYCDLKSIHVPGLLEVLKMYPEFAETFCTEIIHDLSFNLREGYHCDTDNMMHGAHSLTLPSISEDDEEEEDDEDPDCDNDDSGSGSPPSSPSTGGAQTSVSRENQKNQGIGLSRRRTASSTPLLPSVGVPCRRPVLKFAGKTGTCLLSSSSKINAHHGRPGHNGNHNHHHNDGMKDGMDRLDLQMIQMRQDMNRLTDDLRNAMGLLQQLVQTQKPLSSSSFDEILACKQVRYSNKVNLMKEGRITSTPMSPVTHLPPSVLKRPHVTNNLATSSSCSQLQPTQGNPPSSPPSVTGSTISTSGSTTTTSTNITAIHPVPDSMKLGPSPLESRAVQTDKSFMEEIMTKMTDSGSGSPPPNSGYSSSSSNEEKVKYLMLTSSQVPEPDTESISDDSLLRPTSHPLTLNTNSLSREMSPFKGPSPRNSWLGLDPSIPSPLPSPRPSHPLIAHTLLRAQSQTCSSTSSSPPDASSHMGHHESISHLPSHPLTQSYHQPPPQSHHHLCHQPTSLPTQCCIEIDTSNPIVTSSTLSARSSNVCMNPTPVSFTEPSESTTGSQPVTGDRSVAPSSGGGSLTSGSGVSSIGNETKTCSTLINPRKMF